MPRTTKLSLASLVLLGLFLGWDMAHAQILRIGSTDYWFQYWTTVSSNPALYKRYGEFQITSIAWNGPADYTLDLHDGDWNIMARPLPGYEDLLTNAEGRQNYNSLLELEIKSDFPVSSYFHEGDYISVLGWHSEDWGHSAVSSGHWTAANSTNGGKTELHPFIYIGSRSLSWPDFKLFAAQDASGRFPLAYESLDYYFGGWTIPLGQDPPALVPLQQLGSQTAVHSTQFLSESAIVDIGVASMGANNQACWDQYHSVISAEQSPGWVHITPRLGPFGGCLKQGYYGAFQRSEESILRDSVYWSLNSLPSGGVVLDGTIQATLLTPSNHPPFVFTDWRYRETTTQNITSTRENPPNNRVSYRVRYAPALGLYQNTWSLDVMASTRSPDWVPGAHRTANGLPPAEVREFAQARVRHFVTPSSLALDVKAVVSEIPLPPPRFPPGAPAPVLRCVRGFVVSAEARLVCPGVSATPVAWHLLQTTSSTGSDIPSPTSVAVPSDGTRVTLDGVSALLDTGSNQLHVDFDNVLPNHRQRALLASAGVYFANPAQLDVVADCSTSLGEAPQATTHLSMQKPCISDNMSLADEWKDFQKLIWILETLHEKGFGPTLPPTLPATLVQQWQNVRLPFGEPELWYNRLPPSGRRLADTYAAMLAGRPVSDSAGADLVRGLRLASTLPNAPRLPVPSLITPKDLARAGVRDTAFLATGPLLLKPGARYQVRELDFDSTGTITRRSVQLLLDWSRMLRSAPSRRIEVVYSVPPTVGLGEAQRRVGLIQQVFRNAGVNTRQVAVKGMVGRGAGPVPAELRVW